MLFRIFIANATARAVAEIGQALDLAGSVTEATLGFGSWGIEPTVIVEMGGVTRDDLARFVGAIFAAFPDEEAVYVVVNGLKGEIWFRDGRVE